MTENHFDILVSKYLTNELNDNEVLELENILSSNEYYQQKFKSYIATHIHIEESEANFKQEEAFKTFLYAINEPKKNQYKKLLNYVAITAGIILSVLGANFLLNTETNHSRATLVIPNEDIILYDENGESKKIEIDNDKLLKNEFGGIERLQISEKIKSSIKTTNYTLKVPFGKKISLILSDGTKVFLNSGSSISYPSRFTFSKERKVILQGEAYFEVAKNKNKPFIVKTDLLNVRVLGTKFNVSAYKNDIENSVTLVEGKVAVSKSVGFENEKLKSVLLKPNQIASIQRESNVEIKVTKVANTSKHISWKNKELEFKNDKFITIIKKLERNFNVNIISENNNLNNMEFTGNFNKEDVFDILDAFRVHTSFSYNVQNNSIFIQKK